MQIHVCGTSFRLTDAIVSHARSQIAAALASTHAYARNAITWLSDTNGTRGGVDKSCRIMVPVPGGGVLMAESVDEDLYCAIRRAAGMLRQTARRKLGRNRTLHRRGAGLTVGHALKRGSGNSTRSSN